MFYLNEQFLTTDANIDIHDRGFLLGDGLFETLLSINGKTQLLAKHWQRLMQGTITLNIHLSLTLEKLQQIIDTLLSKNNLTHTSACIRITVTRGATGRGILPAFTSTPTVLITAGPWQDETPTEYKLIISNMVRNEQSPLSRIKSLNYLDNILAKQQAIKQNVHDAILLNSKGFVTGTTCTNLFAVKENVIFTPRISDGALPGTIRQQIIKICAQENISLHEKTLSPTELLQTDEIFITNSLIGVKSIYYLEDKKLETKLSNKFKEKLNSYYLLNT